MAAVAAFLNPATWPLIGAGARATMPLWRLLGKGRLNPFRSEIPRVPATRGRLGLSERISGTPEIPGRTAGFLNPGAHPWRFSGALGAGAYGVPKMFGGEEQQFPNIAGTRREPEWSVPPGMPSYEERVDSNYDDQMSMLKEIVLRSGILSSIDKEAADNYFNTMKTVAEGTLAYKKEKQVARITDAVLTSSGTPAQIYKRMTDAGASPDEAMAVSGHQIKIEDSTVGDLSSKERVWEGIVQVALTGNITQAAQMLVQAWGTGLLGGAPMSENPGQRMEVALQYLTQYMQGDTGVAPGMGSGITDISTA